MYKEERGIEIDLIQLVKKFVENLKYIVLVTVSMGVVGYVVSTMFLTPIYRASAKMIINTRKDETQNVTNDQLNSAKNLLDTYAVIIRSRDVVNRVIEELDLPENYEQLINYINVESVDATQVMQISVEHSNINTALAVTEKILEIAPGVIVETVEAGSVKTVEQAYVNAEPISPNIMKNAIILAMVGFALSCAVVLIIFLTDNTYETNMDIQRDLDIPVLGVIPAVESCMGYSKHKKHEKGRN